jgi:GDP/UDP-N,N'-diacetylbacillosamine 2-epimerase (hydrolysing)
MKRKICVVTGSRADYGLLRWLMQEIKDDQDFELQTIVTGSHLSKEFGQTESEITGDGFKIDHRIEILGEDYNSLSASKATGRCLEGIAIALDELVPDLIILLGDRYEIFAAAAAALLMNIPVAHIHGGEVTIGAFDDALRHSITKMSHLHFVAAEDYRKRVIQLGESPEYVFNVGGLGVDSINNVKLRSRKELENELGVKFSSKNLLVTFHPETLGGIGLPSWIKETCELLSELKNTTVIYTAPNSDPGSEEIIKIVRSQVDSNSNAYFFQSLGYLNYLSCLNLVDAVIGNSSSGILEAPSLKVATINIGRRQQGRLIADSVISISADNFELKKALDKVYSDDFKNIVNSSTSPFGNPGASARILKIIKTIDFNKLREKKFYDIEKIAK